MSQARVIEEKEISLSEVKAKLAKVKKKRELGIRATKTEEYLNHFDIISIDQVKELKIAFEAADVPRLRDRHINRLIDIMPEDVDSVKVILSGENLTIKPEHLKKIVEVLNKA